MVISSTAVYSNYFDYIQRDGFHLENLVHNFLASVMYIIFYQDYLMD